ncbi:MAG TPA: phage tail protein [Kofleriaceae bacterium]|nr:phage tail protein [Kofleriaceae bacterium]
MTCGPEPTTFRLLDTHAQWTYDLIPDPGKVTIDDVIQLAQLDPAAVDPGSLSPAMPPPWFARGCEPCEWYLICEKTVLRYAPRIVDCEPPPADRCAPAMPPDPSCLGWVVIAGAGCHIELIDPVAIAAADGRVAILDAGRRELLILSPGGERVIASIATTARGPIAFWAGSIVVADHHTLTAYDLVTMSPRRVPDAPADIGRMVAAAGTLWIASATVSGDFDLLVLEQGTWKTGKLADLLAAARDTGIVAIGSDTVCISIPRGGGEPRTMCIDRCGRPVATPPPAPGPALAKAGAVYTASGKPLDSGIPRCSWHRVRITLDLPPRTGITVSLVTSETPAAPIATEDWQHVTDPAAIGDFLVDQPPGRYLHLRIELRGDGFATPAIHRIRIDFPRSTSATRLPGVFREDPVGADFLDRFLATFDASLEDLDRVIARFPALLDPASTPAEALAWLGTFLDIALDPAWAVDTRRAILREAPELYRRRGTPWAVARAIELTTGVAPALQELGGATTFGRLARSPNGRGFRLGDTRLFGAAKTRFRLDASPLGGAPLRSYGDPDRDYVAATGWRVLVQVPRFGDDDALARLRRLLDAQKPAHVVTQLRVGGSLALVGVSSAVGIDTALGGLPSPYLGVNTRLHRATVLARGRARGGAGFAVGTASALALQTVLS